jgi:hypothetical protein
MKKFTNVVRKLQFPNNFLIKKHFCSLTTYKVVRRKNAGLVRQPIWLSNKPMRGLYG